MSDPAGNDSGEQQEDAVGAATSSHDAESSAERQAESSADQQAEPRAAEGSTAKLIEVEPIEQRLALKGSVPIADGDVVSVELQLTTSGLWLTDADAKATPEDAPRLRLAVLEQQPLRYQSKMLGDRLVIGPHTLAIGTGRGGQAQQMLALARLRRGHEHTRESEPLLDSPFVDRRDDLQRCWLHGWLEPGERVLAWLDSGDTVEPEAALGEATKAPQSWLLTDRRATLVAIGALGDVQLQSLPREALQTEDGMGRSTISVGETRWSTTLTNAGDYRALAAAAGMERVDRLREVARVTWGKARGKGDMARWARRLLRLGAEADDAWAALTLAHISDKPLDADLLAALAAMPDVATQLAAWADGWSIAAEAEQALIDSLREAGHHVCVAALHSHWWAHAHAREKQPLARAELSLQLTRDLVVAGDRTRAAELLEEALASLPSPDVLELVPHVESAEEGAPLHMRLRLLDEMVEVLGEPDAPHLPSLLAIAQLFPLSRDRVQALADAAEGELQTRARALLACLNDGGLEPRPDGAPVDAEVAVLSSDQIEGVLRHPAGRSDGALGRLQALLAEVQVPDHSALKSYCQRLDGEAEPATHAAMQRAIAALASPPLDAYVSRGDKSVGMRAFEGEQPFLLIGGDHLSASSRYHLGPREVAFVIGSEVAHVRFGHARVTSSDLWRGALEKGKGTLELALSVMPALKAFKFGSRIAALAERVQDAPVGTVIKTAARFWPRNNDEPLDPSVGSGHEQLMAAHRVTQFTADRAGLLIAGDLAASFRAIFLTWPAYCEELPAVRTKGLGALLAQHTAEGSLRFTDLAARIGALAAFYLSEDYATLRTALTPTT